MTPKEKAKQLVFNMCLSSGAQDGAWMDQDLSKHCVLIAVDEIIEAIERTADDITITIQNTYWQEVKNEIEKL